MAVMNGSLELGEALRTYRSFKEREITLGAVYRPLEDLLQFF